MHPSPPQSPQSPQSSHTPLHSPDLTHSSQSSPLPSPTSAPSSSTLPSHSFSHHLEPHLIDLFPTVNHPQDVAALLAEISESIPQTVEQVSKDLKKRLRKVLDIPKEARTFANTPSALDLIRALCEIPQSILYVLYNYHPNQSVRKAAKEGSQQLLDLLTEHVSSSKEVERALREYKEGNGKIETLSREQRYFLERSSSLQEQTLGEEEFQKCLTLKTEISNLGTDFLRNLNEERQELTFTAQELEGVPEGLLAPLSKDGEHFIIHFNSVYYKTLLKECTVAQTRKKLYEAYECRCADTNSEVLQAIIRKRHALAQLLGYENYAQMDLEESMLKTPEEVHSFIKEITDLSLPFALEEVERLKKDLPPSATLTESGKIQPWDLEFLLNHYAKTQLSVDHKLIAEYFPLQSTLEGIFDVCSQFFGLDIQLVPCQGLWHESLQMVQISQDRSPLGFIALDLHPREGKCPATYHVRMIPSFKKGEITPPAFSLVAVDLPLPTESQPSLLTHKQIISFVQTFANALHAVLGRTELTAHSGTKVSRSFVSLPPQLLEQWFYEKNILKKISQHYQREEPLPDSLLDPMLENLKHGESFHILQQMVKARTSLSYFDGSHGGDVDTPAVQKQIRSEIEPFLNTEAPNSFETAFTHLASEYGSKYFSFMFAKSLALSIFEHIKKKGGLLDPKVGRAYTQQVLAPGGGADPMDLVTQFLGTFPRPDSFENFLTP